MRGKPLLACGVVLMLLAACLPGPSPTDSLQYNGPFEQSVALGEAIPGTDIRYVEYTDEGAVVLINDQRAIKKVGDSLDWQGSPVPGVELSLTQRVLLVNPQRLQTVGTVKITIREPAPTSAQFPDQPTYRYRVAVTYTVRRGATIPGTTITYVGKSAAGAELGGVSGYPYRKLGDSISWEGRLRSNAYLDTTLRVAAYTEGFLQVVGLAVIGLTEE